MDTQRHFESFYENIRLTTAQDDDARTKYSGVCKALHNYYYPETEYTGTNELLIGSYAKRTNVRPPRDVDVIFIMPNEKYKQYSEYQSNGQSQLLQEIKRLLDEKYVTTETIKAFGKVVVVEFTEGTHTIELVPAWKQSNGTYRIPNSENGGRWEDWNPKAEIAKVIDSNNQTSGKTTTLIRMLKKWEENCSIQIKSYKLEESIVDLLDSSDHQKTYPFLLLDAFTHLKNLGVSDWNSHLDTALLRVRKAIDYETEGDLDKSTDEWRKVFGDDFPKNIPTSSPTRDHFAALAELYPSNKEEFLNRNFGIQTRINPNYRLGIDADVIQNGYLPKKLSSWLRENGILIPKKKLVFKITSNTIPPPYQVKWKVRNFGAEAARQGDLRGEIVNDGGDESRTENTKYKGEHFVECYIIKNNTCVAKAIAYVPIGRDL